MVKLPLFKKKTKAGQGIDKRQTKYLDIGRIKFLSEGDNGSCPFSRETGNMIPFRKSVHISITQAQWLDTSSGVTRIWREASQPRILH